ncbi:MAG: hypothetical protein HUU55_19395 [Myxococcales bacterium]|nr:hypothetical protein [Myxococcales bacterium]
MHILFLLCRLFATHKRVFVSFCVIWGLSGCGVEPVFFGLFDEEPLSELPKAQPSLISGQVEDKPASVRFLGPTGSELVDYRQAAGPGGEFLVSLPGNTSFDGLRVVAVSENRTALALAPAIPKRKSVLDASQEFPLSMIPGMGLVGKESTVVSLVSLASSLGAPLSTAELQTVADKCVLALDQEQPEFVVVREMVNRLMVGEQTNEGERLPYNFGYNGALTATALSNEFLLSAGLDYTGDGFADTTSEPFDAALRAAAETLGFEACKPEGWIRTVFQLDLRQGALDQNCKPIQTFKWATDEVGKFVYFTGGVHKTTPICSPERTTHCISKELSDALNQSLGNWQPNVQRMYDDGTNGDAVADDGIWTRAFALPLIDVATSPDGRGFRVGYKYTYGGGGQGWTESEEWPGNERLIEVVDTGGDGLVIRYDYFGDESSNKSLANALTPANGGCGTNKWENEATPNCQADTRENQIDTDGDCVADAPPPATTAAPVTCDEVSLLTQGDQ